MMTPTIRAKAKSWMMPPPSTKRAMTTTKVVKDVSSVRLKVSLMLRFMISS